jgi:ubiquinone/menaquinone biosynthesis C-methylase UbiE
MALPKDEPPRVIDYEGSTYQSTFWDTGSRDYEDRAEALALKRLLPPGGELLLEVGAGAGRNTPRYKGFERIVLMDYSITQLQQAQARLGRSERYTYVAADVYRLPFVPGLFDAATMIRVLHHMADAPAALSSIRETLQPGAAFILEYANKQNVKAILRYWLKRQSWDPFSLEPVEFAELNFDFHPRAVEKWLSGAGFRSQRRLTVSHFRVGLLKRVLPTGLLVWLDGMAQLTGEWWQFSPSVFVRAQAVGATPEAPPDAFFRCPACHNPLQDTGGEVLACGCGAKWGVQDGIYNFKEPV